jgi:Ca-activated chloride channel homolog
MFANPEYFILLLLLPVGWWWHWRTRHQHQVSLTLSNVSALANTETWRVKLDKYLPFLRVLAFVAMVTALARPQSLLQDDNIQGEGIDIMLTLDLSSSMLAEDFEPNRLEAAKQVASEFVQQRKFDRMGLVVFSGEAFTQCPLTTDKGVLRNFLKQLECGFLQDGTAIGMGLATGVNRLKESVAKSKVIILMTDGENNAGYFKPDVATELARENRVKVYTIGVGSHGEAMSPVGRRSDGSYVMGLVPVSIDEVLLQNIAQQTNGKYFRATNAKELQTIYDEIDRLEKSKIDIATVRRHTDHFGRWLWLGLLLLITELVLRYSVLRSIS